MKNKKIHLIVFFNTLITLNIHAQILNGKLTDYVNPFIGTGAVDQYSHAGNNFPGATLPFGFVQLSPDNKDYPDNPCSGYDYNNKTIVGFSHTHLSGTGVEDLFDVMLMPAIGDIKQANTNPENAPSGYSSNITHDQEKAKPGYYQVNLLDYKINVELTATEHAGFHRYTFPKSSESHILIDMNHSIPKTIDWLPCRMIAQIKIIDSVTVEGYRITTGWVTGYRRVYFRAEFSKPFKSFAMINGTEKIASQQLANGECVKTLLDFNTAEGEQIFVKVGLSATSNENAHLNLRTELPGWDFDKTCREAENKWENELRKIMVKGTKEQMEIFYTAMYHAFTQPNNIADVNGDYPATDMTTKNAPDKQHYSTFSLWDTYRAAHPLYALIQQERTTSFVNSMIRQKKTFGFLPIWQLWGLENYCMIGNHAIPVIVDAVNKNIPGIDIEEAYEAVKASSLVDHPYSPFTVWEKFGYIPEDILSQSVSITIEMAYDDWCVAQFAKKLGKTDDYKRFIKRANFYKNIYDKQSGFFRAKDKNGNWLSPFNPFKYGDNGNSPYTEANAWQYLFHVPQDVNGLIGLMGGPNAFIAKLDSFFSITAGMSEKNMNASGFIGQYAHGNEPSHHVAYLYNYAGQPWKTQKYVNYILKNLYNNSFSGYAGNDDCGQMSAWYIFSAMGFYPVNPANGVYAMGSPILESATINLESGKKFTINTKNLSGKNIYIQSTTLNGKPYYKTYITQSDILSGGSLEFYMGDKPNKKRGISPADYPPAIEK